MYICILIRYSKPNGKTELARYGLHNTQAKEMQFPPPIHLPLVFLHVLCRNGIEEELDGDCEEVDVSHVQGRGNNLQVNSRRSAWKF